MTDAVGTTEPSVSSAPRRFSPVRRRGSAVPVPVLYAGEDLACAFGETVFHDVADDPTRPAIVLRSDLLTVRAGTFRVARQVPLADLRDDALRRYGVSRETVITSPPSSYDITRLWGQLAWDRRAAAGLMWNSRRSPGHVAVMLFVDTGRRGQAALTRRRDLEVTAPPLPLFDGPGLGAVMTAASERNVTVVLG